MNYLTAAETYKNVHNQWPQYYEHVAVAAVRSNQKSKPNIVGFVCVDTIDGRLEGDRVRRGLELAGDHFYDVLAFAYGIEFAANAAEKALSQLTQTYRNAAENKLGWTHRGDDNFDVDIDAQWGLQSAIEQSERAYYEHIKPKVFPPLPANDGSISFDLLDEVKDLDIAAAWASNPEVSDAESIEILRAAQGGNPYAQALVSRAEAKNLGGAKR